jgi:hypothetical protein
MIADKGPATPLSQIEKENFLHRFMEQFRCLMRGGLFIGMEQEFDSYDVAWWVRSQHEFSKHPNCQFQSQHVKNVGYLFLAVHTMASRKIVFHYLQFTNSISSANGIKDVALLAGPSERRCARSFESSVGRFHPFPPLKELRGWYPRPRAFCAGGDSTLKEEP